MDRKDVLVITYFETVGGGLSPDIGAVGANREEGRGKSSVGGCAANRDLDRILNMEPASHGTRTAQRQDMFAYSIRFLDSGSWIVAFLFSFLPSAFFL